jgi:hypothetical protein
MIYGEQRRLYMLPGDAKVVVKDVWQPLKTFRRQARKELCRRAGCTMKQLRKSRALKDRHLYTFHHAKTNEVIMALYLTDKEAEKQREFARSKGLSRYIKKMFLGDK